jgi:hypothetical protein
VDDVPPRSSEAGELGIDVEDRRRALSAYIDTFVSFEP